MSQYVKIRWKPIICMKIVRFNTAPVRLLAPPLSRAAKRLPFLSLRYPFLQERSVPVRAERPGDSEVLRTCSNWRRALDLLRFPLPVRSSFRVGTVLQHLRLPPCEVLESLFRVFFRSESGSISRSNLRKRRRVARVCRLSKILEDFFSVSGGSRSQLAALSPSRSSFSQRLFEAAEPLFAGLERFYRPKDNFSEPGLSLRSVFIGVFSPSRRQCASASVLSFQVVSFQVPSFRVPLLQV